MRIRRAVAAPTSGKIETIQVGRDQPQDGWPSILLHSSWRQVRKDAEPKPNHIRLLLVIDIRPPLDIKRLSFSQGATFPG